MSQNLTPQQNWWFGPNSLWGRITGAYQNQPQQPQPPAPDIPAYLSPSSLDVKGAAQTDWERAQALAEENFKRKQAALDEYKKQIEASRGTIRGDAEKLGKEGRAEVNDARDALLSESQTAAGAARGQYDKALLNTQNQGEQALGEINQGLAAARSVFDQSIQAIKDTRGELKGTLSRVYETAAKGMADFRDQTVQKMGTWVASHAANTRMAKDAKAAELASAGYRPEEIKAELAKMDWDAGVQQAGQLAQFQTEEETRRGDLQLAYDNLTVGTENTVAGLNTTLTQLEVNAGTEHGKLEVEAGKAKAGVRMTEAEQEAAIRDLHAKVGQWQTGVDQATRFGAIDASSAYRLAEQQYKTMGETLSIQGYGSWADMTQSLEATFVPYASVIMQNFGLDLMLQDRNYGYEGAGLSLFNAGIGQWQSTANNVLSTIRNVNQDAGAVGMF